MRRARATLNSFAPAHFWLPTLARSQNQLANPIGQGAARSEQDIPAHINAWQAVEEGSRGEEWRHGAAMANAWDGEMKGDANWVGKVPTENKGGSVGHQPCGSTPSVFKGDGRIMRPRALWSWLQRQLSARKGKIVQHPSSLQSTTLIGGGDMASRARGLYLHALGRQRRTAPVEAQRPCKPSAEGVECQCKHGRGQI